MFVLFGIQTYGIREISKSEKQEREKIVSEAQTFRFILSILSIFIILIISFIIKKNTEFKMILILFSITLIPTSLNMDWFFNGIQSMEHNAVYNLCKNLIPAILIIFLLKNKNQAMLVPIFTFIGLTIGVLYHIIIYKKLNYKIRPSFNIEIAKKYIIIGYPFLISGILSMINNNVDKIIMGFTRGEAELGVYQSAYTFISFLINIIALIFTPVFPVMAKLYSDKKLEKLQVLIYNMGKIISFIAIPLAVGGVMLSKNILILFFGSSYKDGYIPFSILLIYILMLFFREIYGYSLNAWKLEKKYLGIIAVSSSLNLILNLLIIPKYGMIGAAYVTMGTELINLVFMKVYAEKVVKSKLLINVGKAIIPSAIMGIAIYLLKKASINVLIIIVLAIIVYIFMTLLSGFIKISEVKALLKKEG